MRFGTRSGIRALLSFGLAWTAAVAACGRSDTQGGGEAPDSAAASPAASSSGERSRIHGDTVEVSLDEYVIDMPDTIPAGKVVFHLRDLGFEEHDIEIRAGDSVVFNFKRPLNPGESRYIEASLDPGSYRAVCTVSGHQSRGMDVPLVVEGDAGEP